MAPFYGWGSTASRLEPLRGGSLLFTTKFPESPGSYTQKDLEYLIHNMINQVIQVYHSTLELSF